MVKEEFAVILVMRLLGESWQSEISATGCLYLCFPCKTDKIIPQLSSSSWLHVYSISWKHSTATCPCMVEITGHFPIHSSKTNEVHFFFLEGQFRWFEGWEVAVSFSISVLVGVLISVTWSVAFTGKSHLSGRTGVWNKIYVQIIIIPELWKAETGG